MAKINLELSKGQYLELMKLVSLWETVLNGHKLYDDHDKKASALQKYIVDQAVKNNIKDYVTKFPWSNELWIKAGYDISSHFTMELYDLLVESHKEYFTEEIVEVVARNEIASQFRGSYEKMWFDEQENIYFDMIEKVEEEFEKNDYNGLRLEFQKNENPLFVK